MMVRQQMPPDGWLSFEPGFVVPHRELMRQLVAEVPLRVGSLVVGGRVVAIPRLSCWVGDEGARYTYSGMSFEPNPWVPALAELRERLRDRLGAPFNAVLLNYYRDGSDSVHWHADDEPELGPQAPDDVLIATVSLGAERTLWLKRRDGSDRRSFDLGTGSLFVMGGAMQAHWLHTIPKTTATVSPRLSLTFRIVRTERQG